MKKSGASQGQPAAEQISKRIAELGDWRGETLSRMRKLIKAADPDIVEEWKWVKPTKPGTPVWSHDGIICTGESYKNVVKLTFSKGASLKDPARLFNSSEPHLHVHIVNSTNTWQPMKFARGQTTPFNNNTASLNGPWTGLKGNALPSATILVWPPHPIGNWTYNGIEASAYQRVFDHFVDSGEMADTVSCKNNGASYDTTWIPAKGSWISHHGMSIPDHAVKNAQYTKQGYKQTSVYTCGTVMAAIWRKP